MQIVGSSVEKTTESHVRALSKKGAGKQIDYSDVLILNELNRDIGELAKNIRGFIRDQVTGFKKKGVVLGGIGRYRFSCSPDAMCSGVRQRKCIWSPPP